MTARDVPPGGTETDIIIGEIMRGRVGPLEWNFQRVGGGLLKEKYFLWEGYNNFLEPHIEPEVRF